MELIVDLHIHSHYSRATSKDMNLAGIYTWSKIKGIDIVGTGDITHPAWFREVSNKLVQVDGGLYQLNPETAKKIDDTLPSSVLNRSLHFIPTVEISTIYSKAGAVRKIHQVVVLPDLDAAAQLNTRLSMIGNLSADGRPILGLDSKELLKIVLDISDTAFIIPAHIWTPWFGIFGSKSGFDSLEDAYEELTPHISAIETGLSSDPAMNWQIAELRGKAITSHSDAHSPQKLGREATIITGETTFEAIRSAILNNDETLKGTIEFYPQEGKYHYDGHRSCGVSLSPAQSAKLDGICPICGKQLTIGVLNRVEALSKPTADVFAKKVEYIVPLTELIASILGVKSTSAKSVQNLYSTIIAQCGNEFSLLRYFPEKKLIELGFADLASALSHMRKGTVEITPGYDGIYGTIHVPHDNASVSQEQLGLEF